MASLTEQLASWLWTHNPERDHAKTWKKLTHAEKEVYRNWAWELQNYVAHLAREPQEAVPPGYVRVAGYFRKRVVPEGTEPENPSPAEQYEQLMMEEGEW